MTCAIAATGTPYTEADWWFTFNGTYNGQNRRGQVAHVGSSSSEIMTTSWIVTLSQNQTVRCYVYANQTFKIGHAAFGINTNYSCYLEITEL